MMMPILAAVALAAGPVSLQYEGPLKDALKEIAQKGDLNLVVAGSLDEKVQVNLTALPAEEALETLAKVYHLDVTHEGKLWVVRPAASPSTTADAKATPVVPAVPAVPAAPPVPAVPAVPGSAAHVPADLDPDAVRAEAERLQEEAEAMREAAQEQAEAAKERAQDLADAKREQAQAMAEVARAQAEVAKQRVGTGGPVRVEKGSQVDTAVAYGGPVIVEEGAVVDGDAVAFGGDVVLEKGAEVRGDAVAFGGSVVKGEGAVVRGDSVNFGGSGLGSAMARGMVKTQKAQQATSDDASDSAGPSFGNRVAGFLLKFAVLFGLGFLMMMFAPQRMKTLEETVRREPVKNGLAGFLGLIAAIPATVLLVLTLVGIPVAIVLWPAVAFFIAVGLVAIANRVGAALPTFRLRKTQALVLALGTAVLMLVSLIPVLGPTVIVFAGFVGLGAIIRTRFGQPTRGTPIFDPAATQPLAG